MKFSDHEPMVIKGSALAQPWVSAQKGMPALLRVMVGHANGIQDLAQAGPAAVSAQPTHVLTAASLCAAEPDPQPHALQFNGAIESWMPLSKDYDSLRLLSDAGLLIVGTNDLGWVVYDWIPGP